MRELLEKLFRGKEGNVFLLGLFLIISLAIFIIISDIIDVNLANKITGIVFSNL